MGAARHYPSSGSTPPSATPQLSDRLKRMEESAIQEIRARAAELALQATSEIIAGKLDKATNERLIDESIDDVAKKLAA